MPEKKTIVVKKEVVADHENLQQPEHPIFSDEDRQKYTIKSPFSQEFSFPSNIIYYIARNPKFPNGHLKLISTCKYLARMSRILPVKKLAYNDRSDNDMNKWGADGKVLINLKNLLFKLWVHDAVFVQRFSLPNVASNLIKYVQKFLLRELTLFNQVLSFDELQFLVSGGHLEFVDFQKNVVKNSDGSTVEFEKVFELVFCRNFKIFLPNQQHGIGKNTTMKLIEILSSDQIPAEQDIRLYRIPQNFDFYSFSDFLKANLSGRQHSLCLTFVSEISDAYKNQLQDFIDEVIQIRGIYAHTVPVIGFRGLNIDKFRELCKMREETVEGILRMPHT